MAEMNWLQKLAQKAGKALLEFSGSGEVHVPKPEALAAWEERLRAMVSEEVARTIGQAEQAEKGLKADLDTLRHRSPQHQNSGQSGSPLSHTQRLANREGQAQQQQQQ